MQRASTCAQLFKLEVQFGLAVSYCWIPLDCFSFVFFNDGYLLGYRIQTKVLILLDEMESAQAKNQARQDTRAAVPTSYKAIETAIKETFEKLVSF